MTLFLIKNHKLKVNIASLCEPIHSWGLFKHSYRGTIKFLQQTFTKLLHVKDH